MTKSDDIQKLRDENKDLLEQIGSLREEIKSLTNKVSVNEDLESSAEFFSKEYDNFKSANLDLEKITSKLNNIAARADLIEESIESIMQYSYQYNIKILGVPQVDRNESAEESISICLKLFKEIDAKVDEKDIDIAHRTANRNQDIPSPIICKFTRRIAKESVMSKRKGLSDVDLSRIIAYDQSSSASIKLAIFDHLTPKQSQLLRQAKTFQRENNFAYCWTKKQEILLRETPDSRVIKIKSAYDLERLKILPQSSSLSFSNTIQVGEDANYPSLPSDTMNFSTLPPGGLPGLSSVRGAWRGGQRGARGGSASQRSRGGPNTRSRSQSDKKA